MEGSGFDCQLYVKIREPIIEYQTPKMIIKNIDAIEYLSNAVKYAIGG